MIQMISIPGSRETMETTIIADRTCQNLPPTDGLNILPYILVVFILLKIHFGVVFYLRNGLLIFFNIFK